MFVISFRTISDTLLQSAFLKAAALFQKDVPRQLEAIINANAEDTTYYEPFRSHLNQSALTALQM